MLLEDGDTGSVELPELVGESGKIKAGTGLGEECLIRPRNQLVRPFGCEDFAEPVMNEFGDRRFGSRLKWQ